MRIRHDAKMGIPQVFKILMILVLQWLVSEARFLPKLTPVVIRPPPPLVCPPGEIVFNVQTKVCNKNSCRTVAQQRCAVPRPQRTVPFPSGRPAPQPGQPMFVSAKPTNIPAQPLQTQPNNIPAQPSQSGQSAPVGLPPAEAVPTSTSQPHCVTVYERVCIETRSPSCQMTPRQDCSDSEPNEDSSGEEIELVVRRMPDSNVSEFSTNSSSNATQNATTSSSSAPQSTTSSNSNTPQNDTSSTSTAAQSTKASKSNDPLNNSTSISTDAQMDNSSNSNAPQSVSTSTSSVPRATKTSKSTAPQVDTKSTSIAPQVDTESTSVAPQVDTVSSLIASQMDTDLTLTAPKNTKTSKSNTPRSTKTSKSTAPLMNTDSTSIAPQMDTESTSVAPQVETDSSSIAPQVETDSSSIAPQMDTDSTSALKNTKIFKSNAPRNTKTSKSDSPQMDTESTLTAPQLDIDLLSVAPKITPTRTTTEGPLDTSKIHLEGAKRTTSQPPKPSSIKDLLSGGKIDSASPLTTPGDDDSSLPDCPRNMPKSKCKDSKAYICRKINQPLCGLQKFETCSVIAVNQTAQICNSVINKVCRIQASAAIKNSNTYQASVGNSNYYDPSSRGAHSLQNDSNLTYTTAEQPYYSSDFGTLQSSFSADYYEDDGHGSLAKNPPTRSKREAAGGDTRVMTSCAPKTVSVCSTQHVVEIRPSLRMACITVPDLRCEDISSGGPFADRIESCSIYHREICDQFTVFEPVPEPKSSCEKVGVSECYEEVYDASGRNLISRTLKPLQSKIACKDVEAQVCGEQRSVDLVVDECSEVEKTSCQSGYTEKCAVVTKRTCKASGSENPFACVLV